MPKIIIIGHSLFQLLQKCSHMLFLRHSVVSVITVHPKKSNTGLDCSFILYPRAPITRKKLRYVHLSRVLMINDVNKNGRNWCECSQSKNRCVNCQLKRSTVNFNRRQKPTEKTHIGLSRVNSSSLSFRRRYRMKSKL